MSGPGANYPSLLCGAETLGNGFLAWNIAYIVNTYGCVVPYRVQRTGCPAGDTGHHPMTRASLPFESKQPAIQAAAICARNTKQNEAVGAKGTYLPDAQCPVEQYWQSGLVSRNGV